MASRPTSILVVDDEPQIRRFLRTSLAAQDYEVLEAEDGRGALDGARRLKPDLMILDLGLPAGDGFSVLERMKINESLSSMPVIVFSGRDRVGNQDRALKAGASSFLQKPVENDTLLAAIRLILKEGQCPAPVLHD